MLLSIVTDGELRLYEADHDTLEEWGRLRMRDSMAHEELARFSLDLVHLLGINGGHTTATAVASPEPKGLPAGSTAAHSLPFRPSQGQVLAALVALGPMTVPELHKATGAHKQTLSMRLAKMRQYGQARYIGGRWYVVTDDVPAPIKAPRKAPRATRAAWGAHEFLAWVRQHAGATRGEAQAATGLDRQTLNNRLWILGPKTRATAGPRIRIDDDGRIWPITTASNES